MKVQLTPWPARATEPDTASSTDADITIRCICFMTISMMEFTGAHATSFGPIHCKHDVRILPELSAWLYPSWSRSTAEATPMERSGRSPRRDDSDARSTFMPPRSIRSRNPRAAVVAGIVIGSRQMRPLTPRPGAETSLIVLPGGRHGLRIADIKRARSDEHERSGRECFEERG